MIEALPISIHEEAYTRLTFHAGINYEAAVIFTKDTGLFLFLIYDLGQLKCFLPPWYMRIDSYQFINIKIIYDNLGSEISDIVSELHPNTS